MIKCSLEAKKPQDFNLYWVGGRGGEVASFIRAPQNSVLFAYKVCFSSNLTYLLQV